MGSKDIEKAIADAKDQEDTDGVAVHEDEILVDPDKQTEEEAEMTSLQVLLSAKPVRQTRKLRIHKRDGLPQDLVVTVRSLTDREFKSISDQAEQPTGRKQGRKAETETDNNRFLQLIVATAISDPDFSSAEVMSAHGAIEPTQVVQRVFLPGEIARIAEEVMDLSGWSEDAVEVDTAKN